MPAPLDAKVPAAGSAKALVPSLRTSSVHWWFSASGVTRTLKWRSTAWAERPADEATAQAPGPAAPAAEPGSTIVKHVRPGREVALTVPPCSPTIRCTSARPSPVPAGFVV